MKKKLIIVVVVALVAAGGAYKFVLAKPAKAAAEPEPTGINFVDLLVKKKDEEEPPW